MGMNRPYLQIDSSPPPQFDALSVLTWRVIMRTNVSSAIIRSIIPGALYVFVIQQDAAGRHTFKWPANCLNAAPVNLKPNGITVQCFIGLQGNRLNANVPATYY